MKTLFATWSKHLYPQLTVGKLNFRKTGTWSSRSRQRSSIVTTTTRLRLPTMTRGESAGAGWGVASLPVRARNFYGGVVFAKHGWEYDQVVRNIEEVDKNTFIAWHIKCTKFFDFKHVYLVLSNFSTKQKCWIFR